MVLKIGIPRNKYIVCHVTVHQYGIWNQHLKNPYRGSVWKYPYFRWKIIEVPTITIDEATIALPFQSSLRAFQRAKKVVSGSPGLADFAIGLVNSVFNLPDGPVIFFEEFEKQKNCEINSAVQKAFGLVEMTSGLVNVSFRRPNGKL